MPSLLLCACTLLSSPLTPTDRAWIEVKTAWNGTTPKADVGPYTSSANGIFYAQIDAVDLRYVDWAYPAGGINADPLTAQNANVSSSLSTQFLDLAVPASGGT